MVQEEFCYWCGKPATSKEHVPPKCLFPEDRDVKNVLNRTFRNDLITVPSCDEHNLHKSCDDEYLMACLASRVENNGVAYIHTCSKIKRARERNPKLIQVESEDVLHVKDKKFPVQWVNVDNFRLLHSFEAIARALYFNEFRKTFNGECQVVSRIFFNPKEINATSFNRRACKLIEFEMPYWGTEIKGANPSIFTYQFNHEDSFGIRTLSLTFYEKTKIYVILSKLSALEKEKYKNVFKPITEELFRDLIEK